MKINGTEFELGAHTYIMGILNVTPDSFPTAENGTAWTGPLSIRRR